MPLTAAEVPALIAGSLLLAFGGGTIWRQVQTRREQIRDESIPLEDLDFARRQFRRRVQTSALICFIGILIIIGDLVIPWGRDGKGNRVAATFWFAVYWSGVLLLTFWVILLAIGDFLSIRVNTQSKMSRLRAAQRSLMKEAERLRDEQK